MCSYSEKPCDCYLLNSDQGVDKSSQSVLVSVDKLLDSVPIVPWIPRSFNWILYTKTFVALQDGLFRMPDLLDVYSECLNKKVEKMYVIYLVSQQSTPHHHISLQVDINPHSNLNSKESHVLPELTHTFTAFFGVQLSAAHHSNIICKPKSRTIT
ncbi:hypothetical protein CRM22_003439 [Opisthorchis felineus]|uniref:Uncharacterized protein n=1 Tax=Opisthorchis felineus TaxID=147828 RepID=A0A4S2M7B8_OPIFE|nr:hypothetical protein CRM22_003439 [Opisthorchis felineus]